MLLLSVLLDTELPVRQRTEFFLEIHNNASIQATTAEYLGRLELQHVATSHRCFHSLCACHAVVNGVMLLFGQSPSSLSAYDR